MFLTKLTQQNENDGVASQEPAHHVSLLQRREWQGVHLADEAVLVDLAPRLAIGEARCLCPHLLRVLQNHVAVSVEGLDAGEQFAVVAAGDQDLGAVADGSLQDGEGSGGELVLLHLGDLEFTVCVSAT